MIKAQTLKGFRDFLPQSALARQIVIEKIKGIFERFGFDPLETPALEYAETLLGKYGEEADKLLYTFEDNGKRRVGMRYDQTVPLARVVAQYPTLPKPFKRYQIQPVWRAENTQRGRFREFLQCDIDTVGSDSPLADAEIIDATLTAAKALGFAGPVMQINDRTLFDELKLSKKDIITIDKIEKIGIDEVKKNLENTEVFDALSSVKPTERLLKIFEALTNLGYMKDIDFRFNPYLARGLDYYTSTIFELSTDAYTGGSLAGGGRYDNLIGEFTGTNEPAVGIAFGFDRMVEALEDLRLLPSFKTTTQILVTVFLPELLGNSLALTTQLRNNGINTEIAFVEKLEKQLKYADRKGIPFAAIQGPEEIQNKTVTIKNLKTNKQEVVPVENLIQKLSTDA